MFPNTTRPLAKFITIIALLLYTHFSFSQTSNKAVTDAFLITRMAEKFHVQPRSFNDTFSVDFFNQFLKQLDQEKVYFNQDDISQLSAYKSSLDKQVKLKKDDFLKLITGIYIRRLQEADTMIDAITKKPFDFSTAEKFTVTEDTSYPVNLIAMHNKLYKKIKLDVLSALVDFNNETEEKNPVKQKKIIDSAQLVFQNKARSFYKRDISQVLQSPGGINNYVGNEYCTALAACYDPHTEFFPLTEKENFESQLGNERFRFGFAIKEGEDGGILIDALEPGSPAFKCGMLNKGDKFETLQWKDQKAIDVADADERELSSILSQSNHDELIITVKKPDGTLRTVTLVKEQDTNDDDDEGDKVKSFLLKGSNTFGYISLPAFYNNWEDDGKSNNGCANDVAKEILKLKKENISGLILDLRYNGGGSIQEAIELTGIFIDAGPVAQIKSRTEEKIYTLKDVNRGTIYDGPLLILVNGYSASASELVAGSLQNYNRALIVGSSTFGKATGQIVLPLDTTINLSAKNMNSQAGEFLKVTTEKLYRIDGSTAQFTGVKPDIYLPDFLAAKAERESDEPHALLPTNVDANKYYKPYAALKISALQSIAKSDVDSMKYFKQLQNYVREYKIKNALSDVSLSWKDALAQEKTNTVNSDFDTVDYAKKYSIQNNVYDLEKLKSGAASAKVNDAFIDFLSNDPYIKISYDLLIGMLN